MDKKVEKIIKTKAEHIVECLYGARVCLVQCHNILSLEHAYHWHLINIQSSIEKIDNILGNKENYVINEI